MHVMGGSKNFPRIVTGYVLSYDSGDYTDFLNNRRSTIEKVSRSARQVNVNTVTPPWKFK